MSKSAVRICVPALILFTFICGNGVAAQNLSATSTPQTSPKPLRASVVMALLAGAALPANIAFDVTQRGLTFHPDGDFLALITKAGADARVIAALKSAKVSEDGVVKPDMELLQKMADAAVLMKNKQYADAGTKLSDALDTSFARLETGFVMAELLREQEDFGKASAVYAQILQTEPDFPEVHDKASYVLYRLGDQDEAINEAKAALEQNPNDAEAHKNEGLALEAMRKFDAAATEFQEALRIKPDYGIVLYDLGLLHYDQRMYDDSVVEYKKALALDPSFADAHHNLAVAYEAQGNYGAAVAEFREARRLEPNDPQIRQDLAGALMAISPATAVKELKELEAQFPDFETCHVCLGNGLLWQQDLKGAAAEYRWAARLDPTDPRPHAGLGDVLEKQKDYAGALQEYRTAEQLAPDDPRGFQGAGKVLLEKKDYDGAITELKKAVPLAPSNWEVHEQYAKALTETGQMDLAVAEFKEAIALDPTQGQIMTELGGALEKKGDWVAALEQYRKGALTDANRISKMQPGQSYIVWEKDPRKEYKFAKARFADYLVSLKTAGKKDEAAELEKRVSAIMLSGGTLGKMQEAMQAGEKAIQERRFDDAVASFQEAVALGQRLPPGDENMIVALGRLGGAYGSQQKYPEAEQAFHQEMTVISKAFGPKYARMTDPLFYLGQMEAMQKHFDVAENYFNRALEINIGNFGENSLRTAESLRWLAGLSMAQQDWPKAESFLLRSVKAAEAVAGPDDNMTLIPLYGLCDMYDRWDKPEKAQQCWQRAVGIMEKQVGQNSPDLKQPLTQEAKALRKLGRNDEAGDIEQRLDKIQKMAASN